MKKTIHLLLLLCSICSALMVEEFPTTCDDAYFLFESGEISESDYAHFVSLLLDPVCLCDGELERLVPIDVNRLLPSHKDVQMAILAGKVDRGALENLFPSLAHFSPYIDWRCLNMSRSGGVIRSRVVVDSGESRARIGGTVSFAEKCRIQTTVAMHDNSVSLGDRSVRYQWDRLLLELGSIRPELGPYFIKPIDKITVPDSLTVLYGDGKKLNGTSLTFTKSKLYAHYALSYLEQNTTVVGELGVPVTEQSLLSLLGYHATSNCAPSSIWGISYRHKESGIKAVSLWDIERKSLHGALVLRNQRGWWHKSIQCSYTSRVSPFRGYSFSAKLPSEAEKSVFYAAFFTGYQKGGISYRTTAKLVQSNDFFLGKVFIKYGKEGTVSHNYTSLLSSEKSSSTKLEHSMKLSGEWSLWLFRGKSCLWWSNSLSVKNRCFNKNRIAIKNRWPVKAMEIETLFAHTLYKEREPGNQIVVTAGKKSQSIGYFGVTAVLDVNDFDKSKITFFSTLQF